MLKLINLKFKSLLTAALFSGFSSVVTACAQENDAPVPEATTADAEMSFWDMPLLETAFIDTTPENREDGLVVGELGVDGGEKTEIVKLAEEIAEGQYGLYDSLLISHKDKLIFESYFLRGRIDLPHFQASATKTYTSLALGRAIQLGYLTMDDLSKPLIGFFDNLDPTKLVEGAENITLHKALSMRGGLSVSDDKWEELQQNPDAIQGQLIVKALLEHSGPITTESQTYLYGNFNPILVMAVIDAVVPGTAQEFIRTELFGNLGITNYGWRDHISGLPKAEARANITSRDMIKLGGLILHKGKWNGEQLIPEAFIAKAVNRVVHESDDENFADNGNVINTGYGYFWWQSDMKASGKNYFTTSARGGGGQFIILIEELDLIVVTTGHERDLSNLQITAERLLPAFIQ